MAAKTKTQKRGSFKMGDKMPKGVPASLNRLSKTGAEIKTDR